MTRWGPAALASGVDLQGVQRVLESGARLLKVAPQATTVVTLTSNAHIREYNRRYRQVDEPTDVLAFAAKEKPTDQRFQAPPGTEDWLGDIVISLERARTQATQAGHSLDEEVRRLAVHGFLHLLGYDHAVPREERRMTDLTQRILGQAS
jgi:probable rRNA maturation factor